jgi:hypothetical protein
MGIKWIKAPKKCPNCGNEQGYHKTYCCDCKAITAQCCPNPKSYSSSRCKRCGSDNVRHETGGGELVIDY